MPSRGYGAALGTLSLAAAFAAIAFVGKGGTNLSDNVQVEIWLLLAAGTVLTGALIFGRTERIHGVGPFAAFAALAAFTAMSVSWSLSPDLSWLEANRTLTYLFVFAAAVSLGNLLPGGLRPLLGGLTLAAVVIVAYGLASRVWPGSLAEVEFYARLGQPFGYWNALGVTAAIGLVGTIWFGTRRELSPAVAALAGPAAALLIAALLLTYSRSASLATVIALGLWLVAVPLRLRTLTIIAGAVTGALPAAVWALSQDAFTEDGVELALREDAGPTFGLLCVLSIGLAYGFCVTALRWRDRNALSPLGRRRAGRVAALLAGCVLVAGLGGLATTERGFRGTLSDRFHELTDDSVEASSGPGRLGTTASSRGRYWRSAKSVFADHPVVGAGAGAFATTGLRYRTSSHVSRHAHGYAVQTLADLGAIGLLLSAVLALGWLMAALRSVGATPRSALAQRFLLGDERVDHSRAPTWTDERVAVMALFLAALAYGLQSAVDWTWFIPGPTVMALAAAGFVAGRRPPRAPGDPPAVSPARYPARWRALAAGLVAGATVVSIWSAWQPLRADELSDDALALAAQGATAAALDRAEEARDVNPLSPKPLWARAAALAGAGRVDAAHDVLEQVVVEHPNLAQAWLRLADFRLDRLNEPVRALDAVEPALYLDPYSFAVQQSFIDIRDRFRASGELPPDTAPPLSTP